ncbi:unnamed protein product [Xylocopa violacea]|uniref:Mitochondrial carrier protein n=1 Tax=Xylocopa violacea TaxID=135666 RepID=A0ABP1NJP8_XYLVO
MSNFIHSYTANFLLLHRFWKMYQPKQRFSRYPEREYDYYIVEFYHPFAKKLFRVLAAHFAGTAEAILVPLERVQTLLQDWRYHDKFKNTSHAFKYLLKNYGVSECYRGLVPIICRNSCSNLIFFILKEQSGKLMDEQESVLTSFINGALIGGFTSTIFYPMNVIKTHMQSKIGGDFEKFMTVAHEIYIARNRSIMSFYKGVHLNCMRSFISWGVITASYDFLKKIMFS